MGLRSVFGAVDSMRGVYRPIAERSLYLSRFADLPFVFVHVPKTGGTAILEAIGLGRPRVHATAWELRSDHADQLQHKEMLAVYRDPIARFTSAWHYHLQGGNGGELDRRMQKKFARQVESGDFDTIDGLKQLALMSRAFWPQTAYVLDPFGDLAVHRLLDCSRLTDEFDTYCQSRSLDLPRAEKVNVASPVHDDIPDSTLDAARKLYACDYALGERLDMTDRCEPAHRPAD